MWYRWMIEMTSGAALMSRSSYNKAKFALDAAIDRILTGSPISSKVAIITVYKSKQ